MFQAQELIIRHVEAGLPRPINVSHKVVSNPYLPFRVTSWNVQECMADRGGLTQRSVFEGATSLLICHQ